MSRLPPLDQATFTPAQQRVYDSIANSPRGGVRGPFVALLHDAELAARVEQLGLYLRFDCAVPKRLRELTIVTVAAFWRADYEWHAHAPIARSEGVAESVIVAVGRGEAPAFESEDEGIVYRYTVELLNDRRVSDATFAAAHDLLGDVGVLDLATLIGYYGMLAATMNAMQVEAPAGASIPWA